jgi:hypothetical protein
MRFRHAILAASALIVAGALISMWQPRFTLTNAGLAVEYPWFRGAGAFLAALGAGLLAFALRRRGARVAAGGLAVFGAVVGAHLLAYRVEADAGGLSSRGVGWRREVAWSAVSRVEGGPGTIVIVGADETRIEVDTTDFGPEQRASLERTIARRIRDSNPAK